VNLNDIRSVLILLGLLLFLGICVWAWQRGRREAFDEAALLPFADDAPKRSGHTQPGGQP
jgi:cytochrome c oxidase cbb3-type subunit 4